MLLTKNICGYIKNVLFLQRKNKKQCLNYAKYVYNIFESAWSKLYKIVFRPLLQRTSAQNNLYGLSKMFSEFDVTTK